MGLNISVIRLNKDEPERTEVIYGGEFYIYDYSYIKEWDSLRYSYDAIFANAIELFKTKRIDEDTIIYKIVDFEKAYKFIKDNKLEKRFLKMLKRMEKEKNLYFTFDY